MQGEAVVRGLSNPQVYAHATADIHVVETHCAWVVLTGWFVYKLKKPVNFGFLDFSTLEKRRFYCEEEVRLNRRFAPEIYLDVVAVTGTPEQPCIGGEGEVLEYAVRMRQFPANGLLSELAARGALTAAHIDQLVTIISDFHRSAAHAGPGERYGQAQAVHHWVRENFQHIQSQLQAGDDPAPVEALRQWSEEEYARLAGKFAERRAAGAVRECHGDLHLGNITLIDARVTPFDCIEFNPELRWIDVFSEVAFLLMDLDDRGQPRFAQRFLNGYLQEGGDYAGLAVLRYYRVYRAMVRAKVAVLRRAQTETGSEDFETATREYRQYIDLARRYTAGPQPALVIMRGLSGSGKSTVARDLCERHGLIQLRSDVERKRLAGLAATAASRSGTGSGLYTADRTAQTYAYLARVAEQVLDAGYGVIVDATFLKRGQRELFRALAARKATPCLLVECVAEPAVLEARIQARAAAGGDVSEATLDVLRAQRSADEPLAEDEPGGVLRLDTQVLSPARIDALFQAWLGGSPGASVA